MASKLNQVLRTVQQRTGQHTSGLQSATDRKLFANSTKADIASVLVQLNSVYYPLMSVLSSEDTLNALDYGLCGNVVFTHVNATAADPTAYYHTGETRSRTVKETFDVILGELSRLENVIDKGYDIPSYDDTAVVTDLFATRKNLQQLKKDTMGTNYTFDDDGLPNLTYSLSQLIDAMGANFVGWPGTGNSYPAPAISLSLSGAGTGTVAPATFVFRPGGTAGGNVYTDWSLLYADLNAAQSQGHCVIVFDNTTTNPVVIPSGTYDMTNTEWIGVTPWFSSTVGGTEIEFSASLTITNLEKMFHIALGEVKGASPPIVYNSFNQAVFMSNVVLGDGASASVVCPIDVQSGPILFHMEECIFSCVGPGLLTATNTTTLFALRASRLYPDTIEGDATSAGVVMVYDSGSWIDTQSAWPGGVTVTLFTEAESVGYDNSVSGLVAEDVQAAIDEIDVRVGVLTWDRDLPVAGEGGNERIVDFRPGNDIVINAIYLHTVGSASTSGTYTFEAIGNSQNLISTATYDLTTLVNNTYTPMTLTSTTTHLNISARQLCRFTFDSDTADLTGDGILLVIEYQLR